MTSKTCDKCGATWAKCARCGYIWLLRKDEKPKACARCNNRLWNVPKGTLKRGRPRKPAIPPPPA